MLNERISQNSIAGSVRVIRYLLTALSTSFIGAGLVRFAYTPLLPVLIESRWFDTSATVYLSAANPAGALFGAVTSTWLARRYSKVSILRGMNVLATLSLLACAFPISIEWYFFWRFLSGIATGATIVLVAATFLPHVPAHRKGVASGLIFAGLGLGIAATGTLVPFLLRFGLRATWIWLAVFAAALTVLTWTSWPPSEFITKRQDRTHHRQVPSRPGYLAYLTHLEVALMALTVVAPMLFLVNFVAQDLHAGVYIGSLCWAGYGLGAMLGPPVYGYAADRLGAITALRWTFLVQTIGLIWLTRANNLPLVAALSVLIGTFISGMIPLMQACIRERIPDDIERQTTVWSKMVTTYVGALTIGAYVYSAVLNASNGAHRTLFALSILAVGLCLLIEFLPVASNSWSVVARNLQHRNRTQRKILQEHRTDS